ncbi:hypothetical protein C8R46DRAFT_1103740 [Mycena filopes]|nr:hypothetical protein C8R46DRAFT_1103740 [Mycena filopes]
MVVPVGKIPTELLVEVFTLAAQPDLVDPAAVHTRPKGPFDRPIHPALTLSQICSSWREIAIGTPRLWASEVVELHLQKTRRFPQNYLDGMKTLLERSNPLPISVLITSQYVYSFDDLVNITTVAPNINFDVLLALMPSSARWRDLKLLQDAAEVFFRLEPPPGPFAALETLELQYGSSMPHGTIHHLFLNSPRLRRLTSMTYDEVQTDILQMPWAQLTHLDLQEPSFLRSREILLQCTNVVSVSLVTREWDPADGEMDAPPTILPFLRFLKLEFYEADNPGPAGGVGLFFAPLCAPELDTLELEIDRAWCTPEFFAFQRGSPNLASLALRGTSITSSELVTVLPLAPVLTAFWLYCCEDCIDDAFLDAFTYHPSNAQQQLVPRLQTMKWQVIGANFQPDKLEAAIRSRWWKDDEAPGDGARLRLDNIQISITGAQSETFIDSLQDLVAQGLALSQD